MSEVTNPYAVPQRGGWPSRKNKATSVGAYPDFYRLKNNKMVAGVCSGLAAHLGVDVTWVRVTFVALMAFPSLGIPIYLGLWLFTDSTDRAELALTDVAKMRMVASGKKRMTTQHGILRGTTSMDWLLCAIGVVLALIGGVLITGSTPLTLGLTVAVIGVLLVWQTFGQPQRTQDAKATPGVQGPARFEQRGWQLLSLIGGVVLLFAGLGGALFVIAGGDVSQNRSSALGWAFLAALLLIIGFIVLLVPLWLHLWKMANKAAVERAAENERAEIASRIHDSVLQTLTIIQKTSKEPETVTVARSQERQLRQWLFGKEESVRTQTLFGALRVACGEVEDQYGIQVRPVAVGEDRPTDDRLLAVVLSGREAMVNAAKHSGCKEINVFMEAEDGVELFVRDRGPGFDLEAIPEDRQGVRQSILGRMERAGGSVEFDTGPAGTEVIITLPAG